MKTIILHVEGANWCGSVRIIKKSLSILYGIDDVRVDMPDGKVTVICNDDDLLEEVIVSTITAAGFKIIN